MYLRTEEAEVSRRRRHHNAFQMVLMGIVIFLMFFVTLGFQFLATFGGKAFLMAKLALLLASINGLKRVSWIHWLWGQFYWFISLKITQKRSHLVEYIMGKLWHVMKLIWLLMHEFFHTLDYIINQIPLSMLMNVLIDRESYRKSICIAKFLKHCCFFAGNMRKYLIYLCSLLIKLCLRMQAFFREIWFKNIKKKISFVKIFMLNNIWFIYYK